MVSLKTIHIRVFGFRGPGMLLAEGLRRLLGFERLEDNVWVFAAGVVSVVLTVAVSLVPLKKIAWQVGLLIVVFAINSVMAFGLLAVIRA